MLAGRDGPEGEATTAREGVMAINQMNLRSLRSPADAVALLRLLGYDAPALPVVRRSRTHVLY
jgi:hypothetical protein